MMVMERLEPRQKQEWKTALNDNWIRTGCHSLWDAVFIAFREYRDASPKAQMEMIKNKTQIEPFPLDEWLRAFYERYEEKYRERDEPLRVFFRLLPLRFFCSEMVPYLQDYLQQGDGLTMEQLREEIIDKCALLADYRQKKKGLEMEDVRGMVRDCLTNLLFPDSFEFSYDSIQEAMANLEHQLILVSPLKEVLFDSKTWGNGVPGGDYQDVILVLAHPDNTYDSIGRLSYTKDGHQKISRLFHYDDEIVETLRGK